MTVSWVLPFTLQNGQTADADDVMANFNAGVAALTNAAASGVNSDITALTALSVPITPLQGGTASYWGGTSTGANTIVAASLAPSGFSLTAGRRVTFRAGFTNTGPTTFNANGTGAKDVFRMTPAGAQACAGGEIVAGTLADVVYDGTQFQLVDVAAQFGGVGPVTALAAGTTTDLGTVPSHLANITGATTITSFGSSAGTTYPFYWIGFQSALTLTNGSALLLPGAADILTAAGDSALAAYAGAGNWQVLFYQRAASAPYRRKAPTYQDLTSGSSATYTAPTPRPAYLKVRAVAGGGGGGGSGNGGVGGTTTFNGISAIGGNGGVAHSGTAYGTGGIGGTAGSGAAQLRISGGDGGGGVPGAGAAGPGGMGGGTGLSAGGGGNVGALATVGAPNTGCGGGGLASVDAAQGGDGGGGGGEYFELIIDSPAATYTYTVGAAGTAGTGGVAGAAGRIIVEEFYN